MVAETKQCSPCLLEVMGKRVRVMEQLRKHILPTLWMLLTSINAAIIFLSLISVNNAFGLHSTHIYLPSTHKSHKQNTLFDPEHYNLTEMLRKLNLERSKTAGGFQSLMHKLGSGSQTTDSVALLTQTSPPHPHTIRLDNWGFSVQCSTTWIIMRL
jgi:hypothetical protein